MENITNPNEISLKEIQKIFKGPPKYKPMQLIDSIKGWKLSRKSGLCFSQWSDNELRDFDKDTRLIGTKCGVECYVQLDISEMLKK